MDQPIVNRVANSSLVTFNLEEYAHPGELVELDIKEWLYEGIILKEKDFREKVRDCDWSSYENKNVALFCSEDAIVPTWAYMLVAIKLEPYVNKVVLGKKSALNQVLYADALSKIDWNHYQDSKVVIKGCSDKEVPASAYVEAVSRLRPIAASLMYGEPCSTVPLYKKPKK